MTFAKLPPLPKTLTKCCACHEKTTHLHWRVSKVLRLSRKTRKRPPILWLGSSKTSISCEASSTFHTLKERIVSQCVCTAQWREINDAATTTTRRRDDQHDANTGPTPDPNYKREPFATHPGKNMEKQHSLQAMLGNHDHVFVNAYPFAAKTEVICSSIFGSQLPSPAVLVMKNMQKCWVSHGFFRHSSILIGSYRNPYIGS